MRISIGVAAAAALTVMAGGSALASGPESAYLGVGGGGVFLQDTALAPNGTVSADTGWVGAGTIGLRWENGLRLELEGAHRESDATATGVASGQVKSSSIFANLLYDFKGLNWGIVPYLGIGVGGVRANYDFTNGSKNDAMGYQAIVGASVPFSPRLEGFVDYRYFGTDALNDSVGTRHLDDPYAGHEVMVGIRWTFWEAPKPVAAAPAPAPVAQPKDYVIYFEFDKSNVTKAAGAVLDELKATSGNSSVSVVGHTDTMGSAAYNQKLSDRRASNPASALEQRKVKVDSVSGKGFTEPAVNTGPGVKEPLNRRAVIKLNSGATQ